MPKATTKRSQPESPAPEQARVHALRRFNRFFTQRIGVLHEGLLDSRFSLAEVRLMYELAHRNVPTAAELCEVLGFDPGYVSRLLRRLGSESLVTRRKSDRDGRAQRLSLTSKGKKVFSKLEERQHDHVAGMLRGLGSETQDRLLSAMSTIEDVLGPGPEEPPSFVLRPHRPGDMGWVVSRHGELYSREQGWDDRFEALVADIVLRFMRDYDPRRDRCWIAERDGRRIGSVFLVKDTLKVAKLRLLLVEPAARGLGVGRHLVEECVRTARQLGYRKLTLWTNDVLHAARSIYQAAGFRLVREEAHHSYGHDLVGQYWELDLAGGRPQPRAAHYLLLYDVTDDFAHRSEAFRTAHLEHAWRAYKRGELLLAGATADPPDGAVLVFQGDSPGAAESFAKADPYVREGLVTSWRVRPWKTVVGTGAAEPLLPEEAAKTVSPPGSTKRPKSRRRMEKGHG